MKFKTEHVLQLKILTICQNEETKMTAEDFLEINLLASFHESDLPVNSIRTETDKLVASIATHPHTKMAGVERSCILLSFKSYTPSGLIHILDFCDSQHFQAILHNISNELHYVYEDVFLLQGHVTLGSLSRVIRNVNNTENGSYKGLSIPVKCSSADGIRYVLETLKKEKTTNRLNNIATKISVELNETVSIYLTPDLLEFRDVFDETDSDGSGSGDINADKANDRHSTEEEMEKLDIDRKAAEHPSTIWTNESEENTSEHEDDSTSLLSRSDINDIRPCRLQKLKNLKERRSDVRLRNRVFSSYTQLFQSDETSSKLRRAKTIASQYLRNGLTEFVDEIVKQDFNVMLLTIQKKYKAKYCNGCALSKLLPAHTSISGLCPLGQKNCNCVGILERKPCPSHFCDAIYDEIIKRHRYSSPSWSNSNVEKWLQNHWEIAKCFIGYRNSYMREMSATETSTKCLLDVIINNVELQHSIRCKIDPPSDIFSKARAFISSVHVTDWYQLRANIDYMTAILTDRKYIYRKPAAQKAVQDLLKLRNDTFGEKDFDSLFNPVSNIEMDIVDTVTHDHRQHSEIDLQTYERQSELFEDTHMVYSRRPVAEIVNVKTHATKTTQSASMLSKEHDEKESVLSERKHSKVAKYTSGFRRLHTVREFTEIFFEASDSYEWGAVNSSETSAKELLGLQDRIECMLQIVENKQTSTTKMPAPQTFRKELLRLQDRIECLLQTVENIQTSTTKMLEPQNSDYAILQDQMFQEERHRVRHLREKFVVVKESFLPEIIMKDWQYMKHKQEFRNYLIYQYMNTQIGDFHWGYYFPFDIMRLKSQEGTSVYSYSDIFYQNDEKCMNVYVKGGDWICSRFFERLINNWCDAYSRNSEYSDDLYDVLKEFEFVFMISLIDIDAEVYIHEIITNQLGLEGEHFSIFEQVLFLESEKCLIILEQPNEEIKGTTVPRAMSISNKQLPLRRPIHDYVVLTTIQSEQDLELGKSDRLLHCL